MPLKLTLAQARKLKMAETLVVPRKRPRKGKAGRMLRSAKEKLFDALCIAQGLPVPVHEYQFASPRKWRFDYVFEGWLALECQGGLFTGGRHVQGAALLAEHEKLNEAVIYGFSVLFCTPDDIKSGAAFALVRRALGAREEMS